MCDSDKSEAALLFFIISLRGIYFGDNPLSPPFLEPVWLFSHWCCKKSCLYGQVGSWAVLCELDIHPFSKPLIKQLSASLSQYIYIYYICIYLYILFFYLYFHKLYSQDYLLIWAMSFGLATLGQYVVKHYERIYIYIQVHLNKLECHGKVNLFQ